MVAVCEGEYPEEFVLDVAIRLMQKRSTLVFASASDSISFSCYHKAIIAMEKPTDNRTETAQKEKAP
jgi:hypothetical protein